MYPAKMPFFVPLIKYYNSWIDYTKEYLQPSISPLIVAIHMVLKHPQVKHEEILNLYLHERY